MNEASENEATSMDVRRKLRSIDEPLQKEAGARSSGSFITVRQSHCSSREDWCDVSREGRFIVCRVLSRPRRGCSILKTEYVGCKCWPDMPPGRELGIREDSSDPASVRSS
jgi:hypothetical protein